MILVIRYQFRAWKTYKSAHIPEAIHVDLNVATYPGEFDQYMHYPPKIFEEYVRILGINVDDYLILYDRGPLGGMMFASRIAWLFKVCASRINNFLYF